MITDEEQEEAQSWYGGEVGQSWFDDMNTDAEDVGGETSHWQVSNFCRNQRVAHTGTDTELVLSWYWTDTELVLNWYWAGTELVLRGPKVHGLLYTLYTVSVK